MTSVRRSTRLSSANKPQTPTHTRSSINALQQTPRRTQLWQRRRQTTICTSSSEETENAEDNELEFYYSSRKSTTCAERNKENLKNFNIAMKNATRERSQTKKNNAEVSEDDVEKQQLRTPRRGKASCQKRTGTTKRRAATKKQGTDTDDTSDDDSDLEEGLQAKNTNGSPPKQARLKQKSDVLSPSRLLDRLSIDERQDKVERESKEDGNDTQELSPESVIHEKHPPTPSRNKYQNARRVLSGAETQNLPGREKELTDLRDFFRTHIEQKRSGSLYVSGQPGTGKTACLSLLLRSPELSKCLQCVYINCTSIASINGVYKKMCTELHLQPGGRSERDYLTAVQKHFRTSKRTLLLVLDEIDQLCSTKQSVLYTIFEWPSLPGAQILLVGIANSLDLTERTLTRLNARCELKPQHMHFAPYTKQQIVEIFRSRLEEAGVLDVFPPVTLQLLAAKVSAVSGDVRRALDIGRRVVEIAEQQMKMGKREIDLKSLALGDNNAENKEEVVLKPVQVAQVAEVLNKVYGVSQNLQEDIEDSFPLQQKIILCTLMLMLRKERNKDITIGRLHEVYRRICAKRNIHVLDQAEFGGLVDLVETRGILRIIRKKEPRLCKVVLQWDEEEVNGALKDKQLISSILDDTSCLGKC